MVWAQPVPQHNHVVVVAFENHSYESKYGGPVGNSAAPYFNDLIAQYGLASQFYADAHDSLSEYFWMLDGTANCITGSTQGCGGNPTLVATADSVIREVIRGGKTWKQYSESLPANGSFGPRGNIIEYTNSNGTPGINPTGNYYARHAPAIYLSDVRQGVAPANGVDCSSAPTGYDATVQACNVVSLADPANGLQADLNAGTLPNFSLIIPNGCDDAHDCSAFQPKVDPWMNANLGPLLNSKYFQPGGDGLLIIWWDEGTLSSFSGCNQTSGADDRSSSSRCSGGGGRIAVVIAAPDIVRPGYESSTYYQHPAITRLILDA